MHIENWLEYQNIMDKIYLENLKYQIKLKKLQEENFEQSLDLLQSQTKSMNAFSIDLFSSFKPKHEDIKKIKALWLEVLDMQHQDNNGELNLDYGDYEEMSELLEHIDDLNKNAEKTTFSYFLEQESSPCILDWINYRNLKKHIDDQETVLAKQHVVKVSQANEFEQTELARKFIKDTTALKLDILNKFNACTPELKNIIERKKGYLKIGGIKNTHFISNPSLENEYRTYMSETDEQIKEMEISFERNSLKLMCEYMCIKES